MKPRACGVGAITKRLAQLLLLFCIAAERPCAAGADTFPLQYVADEDGPPLFVAGWHMAESQSPPFPIRTPAFRSARPRFLLATIGTGANRFFTFALDESTPGAGYDLLYADTNHNQDLSDEKPVPLTRWPNYRGFRPVPLTVTLEGRDIQYSAAVSSYVHPPQSVFSRPSATARMD